MLESIFTSKDLECPCCGAQGTMIKPRGSDTFVLLADTFRKDTSSGALDIVCIKCSEPAIPMLRSGYN